MVYRVRSTLTEEDRRAWKRVAVRRKRNSRSAYRFFLLLWLLMKLLGFALLGFACYSFFAILKIDEWIVIKLCYAMYALIFLILAYGLIRFFFCPPIRPRRLPRRDFPPAVFSDVPFHAAFFEDGCFVFWNSSGKTRLNYQDILEVWEDKLRFYVFLRDYPPLILRKCDFAGWNWQAFRNFMEEIFDWEIRFMK